MLFTSEVSSEVVQGRESFKRFIRIILNQFPALIEKYPPSDQLLLTDFLSVLQHYEEADYQRKKLSQRFEKYNERVLETEKYLYTAFLWFVYNYFSNANLLLNISKFHADSFYEYLAKHLRGSSTILGVYGLMRGNVLLSDLVWERLQYESNKLLVPLTNDQLQILKTVYSFITEAGVYTLDPRKLRSAIVKQVKFPKNLKPTDELNRFFSLIDGRWFLHSFDSAFDLENLVFHIQLQESTSLKDIIDFRSPTNTVLTVSDVYRAKDLPNTYIGNLLVPIQEIGRLKNYLQHCERQGYIILKELSKIRTIHKITSLSHYRANTGWFELSPTKMRRLTQLLTSKHPKKRRREISSRLFPPPFSLNWHYSHHPFPTKIINLFCKIPKEYSFLNLPLGSTKNQEKSNLSRTEIGLLKQLHYNRVVNVGFLSFRLMYDFSLDAYWIVLPTIPIFQLKRFLDLLPFSEIYFTNNNVHIWARLTQKLVHWIENDLNWVVMPIMRSHYPLGLKFKWFDTETLQWNSPNVLRE